MTAWTERVRVGTRDPAAAAVPPGDRGQAARRPRRPVGRPGLGRASASAASSPTSSRPSACRSPSAAPAPTRRWTCCGRCGRAGRSPTTARFFDLDDVELRPVMPPAPTHRRCSRVGPPLSCRGARSRPCAAPRAWATAGCRTSCRPSAYARSVQTVRAEAARPGRDLAGFEWMMYLYCSIRRDGDRARNDVRHVPRRRLRRQARRDARPHRARRARPRRWRRACRSTSTPASATSSSRRPRRDDTLEVVTLAAEEVLPRLTLPDATDRRPMTGDTHRR